jgi:hypothetical protein
VVKVIESAFCLCEFIRILRLAQLSRTHFLSACYLRLFFYVEYTQHSGHYGQVERSMGLGEDKVPLARVQMPFDTRSFLFA